MKSSLNKTLERDFSLEKNMLKEKMKKIAEISNRDSKAIKNLKNDLHKSASKKNLLDPMDDLYLPSYRREYVESRNFATSLYSSNSNINRQDNLYGKEKKNANFGETFSSFKSKSFVEVFSK